MALFRSEQGIGRGEPAESRLEFPFFVLFMLVCAIALFFAHFYIGKNSITLALAVSMVVFGMTVLRVDLGVYCITIAMLLSPEIDAGGVGQGERHLTLRYDDVLIIVIFVGVLVKQAFIGKHHLWLSNPINTAIFLYYGVCCVSTALGLRLGVTAYDKNAALFVMLKMAQFYMIFLLVGNAVNDAKQVRYQLVVFFVVAMIVNLYALYARQTAGRISAPFETGGTEPNTIGGYLVVVMCVGAGLFVHAPTRRTKIACLIVVFGSFVPFLLALSRASYIAFIVSALLLGIVGRKPAIVAVVVVGLFAAPYIMPEEVLDRVNYTFQRGSGEQVVVGGVDLGVQVDKSTFERISVWNKVRYNLANWPWLGGGVNWGQVLDSQYARVIIETGLFGLVAFLFLQYRILHTTRQTYLWSTDWIGKGLGLGAFVATIGMIVHSLGTITFLIVRIMGPFWFVMALAIVCRQQAIQEYWDRRRDEQDASGTDRPSTAGAQPAAAPSYARSQA
jgi:hypothetical protein